MAVLSKISQDSKSKNPKTPNSVLVVRDSGFGFGSGTTNGFSSTISAVPFIPIAKVLYASGRRNGCYATGSFHLLSHATPLWEHLRMNRLHLSDEAKVIYDTIGRIRDPSLRDSAGKLFPIDISDGIDAVAMAIDSRYTSDQQESAANFMGSIFKLCAPHRSSLWTTEVKIEYRCSRCHHKKVERIYFPAVPLVELPEAVNSTLGQLLEEYQRVQVSQKLQGDEYFCPCVGHKMYSFKRTIVNPANIFMVTLRNTSNAEQKSAQCIKPDPFITVMGIGMKLCAYLCHSGPTYNSGHFYVVKDNGEFSLFLDGENITIVDPGDHKKHHRNCCLAMYLPVQP